MVFSTQEFLLFTQELFHFTQEILPLLPKELLTPYPRNLMIPNNNHQLQSWQLFPLHSVSVAAGDLKCWGLHIFNDNLHYKRLCAS